ncbi:MAG: hypothetical protein QOF62_2317 [Pyrinomonadaceae bacterium]|nr:hypothetical protein [Pyrinomonadaceae bacterium]
MDDPTADLTLSVVSTLPASLTATVTGPGALTISGNITVAAGVYPINLQAVDPHSATTDATVTITVTKENTETAYTGDQAVVTAGPSIQTATVRLGAHLTQEADGAPGNITLARVTFELFNSNNNSNTPDRTVTGVVVDSNGDAFTFLSGVVADTYVVKVKIDATNGYWTANLVGIGTINVAVGSNDQAAMGGGWVSDGASINGHGNFGFTVRNDKGNPRGTAAFTSLNLNDGFIRVPRLDRRVEYSSRMFFTQTYNTGNVYDYEVEIPSINFVKLHGSISWTKDDDDVICRIRTRDLLAAGSSPADLRDFVESYAVVLPQTTKFRTTLMERTYYELLRIYANELDKANTLLISFGFSFNDSHILDMTKKALKNPTLKLIAFAFNDADREAFAVKFDSNNNVEIVTPAVGEEIGFQRFNELLRDVLPRMEQNR